MEEMENRGYNPKVYLIGPGPLPLLHQHHRQIVYRPSTTSSIVYRCTISRLKKVSLFDFETHPQVVEASTRPFRLLVAKR